LGDSLAAGHSHSGALDPVPDSRLHLNLRSGAPGNGATLKGQSMLGTILLIVLVLLLVGALPAWPYSRGWGYYPGGGLGLILLIVLILVLMGRI
jgi:uncharacterized protein DUF3309